MKTIPILMYHQIDLAPPKGSPMRGLVVSPRTFYSHMLVLWALGFRGLSMSDLEPYLRGEREGRIFGITFDDGYENNLRCALPVLRRFGFSSTCYVVTEYMGKSNRWDAQNGIAQVPLMNEIQLQQWVDGGQEIGSHSLTHANLPSLSVVQQFQEITDSKSVLETGVRQLHGVRHFCYPYGLYDSNTLRVVQDSGYHTATTTARGRVRVTPPINMLELPRVLVSRTTTCFLLLLKCFTRYEDRKTNA